jgi:iron complex transport system ATP-binding protein
MTTNALLQLNDARVVRDGRTILDIRELTVHERERVAILGPNGSGKSTLIKLLTRDVLPLAGEPPAVLLQGRSRWDLFEARRLFGIVSDDLQEAYDRRITVSDAVLSGYFGSIGLYRPRDITPAMRDRGASLMAELEISHLSEGMMNVLSTGEARRALIARALVFDPPVLVLDEPCDGLDASATYHFLRTLSALLQASRGLLLVTHHIDDIVPEVDRVIMLKDGRVFADGPKAAVLTDSRLSALFGIPVHVECRDGVYRLW